MTKAQPNAHGEVKTERISALVTATAKQKLNQMAAETGVSLGELLERIGRGQMPQMMQSDQRQLLGESSASS